MTQTLPTRIFTLPITLPCLGLALLLLACGCNKEPEEAPTYPVTGEMFYKGKPATKAVVVFRPLDGSEIGPWPRGIVDENGRYQLTLRRTNDGAEAGEYAITVVLFGKGDDGDVGPNILPVKYSRPGTSDLRATVSPGENTIPRIDLKP